MAGGRDTLAKLLHVRVLQYLAKLGLPHQEGLQQGLLAELEVGQHAQFFHRARSEVLGFVHDQQAALAFTDLGDKKGFQRHQQVGLGDILHADAEGRTHHAQGVLGVELGAHQIGRGDEVGVHALQQAAHDGGLASADLASDDNEAFAAQQAVFQVGLGAAVLLAAEVEARVRVELKGLAGKPVEAFVHGSELHLDSAGDSGFRIRVGGAVEKYPARAHAGAGFAGELGRQIQIERPGGCACHAVVARGRLA